MGATEGNTEVQRQETALITGALQIAIFNSANFSSIATDAKGVIQIFNVGAERMLGYAAADVMNKITPADISDPQEVIARAEALSTELGTPITPGFEALVFKAYHVLRGNALGMQARQANFLKAMTLVGDIRGAYEKAVQLEPANRSARSALFSYYFNAPGVAGGGVDKAEAFADQTLPHDTALAHYFKGLVRQKQKNPGAAQAEYRLALAADPKYAAAYNVLGYVELEMKQLDEALAHFQKQAELEPDNANSYDSLGDGWKAKGRLDEAIQSYRKALALNPTFPSSMRSLGQALEQAGRRDEAIQHYRHSAQLGAQQGIPQAVTEAKARLKALGVAD